MLYTSNVCHLEHAEAECSAEWLGVTAANANMCETNISVWAGFQIVGRADVEEQLSRC